MELMKEGGEEVGTPSKSISRRRRRRRRTTFSSAKQWRLRDEKRREAGLSVGIDQRPSWRLGCKIRSIHLESIPEEVEAPGSASRSELASSAMAELKSEQPSFTAQTESEDMENDQMSEDSKIRISIEKKTLAFKKSLLLEHIVHANLEDIHVEGDIDRYCNCNE